MFRRAARRTVQQHHSREEQKEHRSAAALGGEEFFKNFCMGYSFFRGVSRRSFAQLKEVRCVRKRLQNVTFPKLAGSIPPEKGFVKFLLFVRQKFCIL